MRPSLFRRLAPHAFGAGITTILGGVIPAPAGGQGPTGSVAVVVVNRATSSAIPNAAVSVSGKNWAGRRALLDTTRGETPLLVGGLAPGPYRIEVRAVGFAPFTADTTLSGNATVNLRIELDRVAALASVESRGAPVVRGRLAEFERRRVGGKGTFLTKADLKKGQTRLVDALKSVRGLRIDCRGAACYVRMIRSTACEPRIFLDGFPADIQALNTPILDIGGVEIYRGPSETPPEFSGADSMCGVIAIWTSATSPPV
jgi:hypothetical protein